MNQIEKLIAKLCPNGVAWVELGQLIDYEQPTPYLVSSTEYDNSYPTPVLTAGQTFLLGYTKESEGIYQASKDDPVIIFDDFTTATKWVDFNFKAKSSAMKMLKSHDTNRMNLRFFWFYLPSIIIDTSQHTRYWISKFTTERIPLPPIEIQNEIVKILDTFSELEAELEAELKAREAQYKYYKNLLLSFGNLDATKVQWVPIFDVSVNLDSRRKPVTKDKRSAGNYPYYGASGIVDFVEDYLFDGDYLLVSEDGANLLARSTPIAFSIGGKNWVNNHAHVLQFESYELRRLTECYLNSIDLSPYVAGGAQPKLSQSNLNRILVPVPPTEELLRVVQILDSFESLIYNQNSGLLAEISARKKQYEYYRDKLLTFKELESA